MEVPGTIAADPYPGSAFAVDSLTFTLLVLNFGFAAGCFVAKVFQRVVFGLAEEVFLCCGVHCCCVGHGGGLVG